MNKSEQTECFKKFYNFAKGMHTHNLELLIQVIEDCHGCQSNKEQIDAYKRVINERDISTLKEAIRRGQEWI